MAVKDKQDEIFERFKSVSDGDYTKILLNYKIDTTNGAVGRLDDTLNTGLVTWPWPYPGSTVFAIVVGSVIDLFPIFFCFFAFRFDEDEEKEPYNPIMS